MKRVDEEQELMRLLAQEPSPLTSSLGQLRERGPDAAELASLASRLALRGIDVTPARPLPRANSWKKWAMGGAGAASAVVLWLMLRSSLPVPRASSSEPQPRPAVADATASMAPPPVARGTARPKAVDDTQAVEASRAVASSTVIAPLASGREASSAPLHEVGPGRAPAPSEAPLPDATPLTSAAPSSPALPRSTTGSRVAAGVVSSAPMGSGGTPALTEIELLRDARLALRQSPARALELTDEHARQYPRGKLTQERELIAVSALVALGRRTAAMSRAATFERLNPTSPYRKQMGDLLR